MQEVTGASLFCSVVYEFYPVSDKFSDDHYKDEVIPSIKANDRPKSAKDVAMNHVRDMGKQRWKIWYE